MVRGTRLLVWLALTLFPCFALLDVLTQPARLNELLLIRGGAVAMLFVLFLAMRRERFPVQAHPFFSALTVLAIAAASITGMCMVLDGYRSPYYAGVNLVVLAAGLVIPCTAVQMAKAVGTVISIYLAGVSLQAGGEFAQPELLINNLSFLLGTGVISVASARLAESMRRESFARLLSLEETQSHLEKALLAASRAHELEEALGSLARAEKKTKDALAVRDEFISIASHELKTPLTSLSLHLELAQRSLAPEHKALKVAGFLVSSMRHVERVTSLVEELLDVTRIQSGKITYNFRQHDLAELLGEARLQHPNLFDEARAPVRTHAEGPVPVFGDRERIEQILVNLLSNALKYGEGSAVDIYLSRNVAGEAELRVHDSGVGIAAEHLEKIFERFERINPDSGITGLGLGLYISRQIALAHHGSIRAESSAHEGTTFFVTLPGTEAQARTAAS